MSRACIEVGLSPSTFDRSVYTRLIEVLLVEKVGLDQRQV